MIDKLKAQKYINLKRLDILKWIEGRKRPMQLSWALRDGYPRIVVYLNEENKKGFDNMHIVPFSPPELATFVSLLKRIPTVDNNTTFKVECYNLEWKDGEKTKNKYKQGEVEVGKDEKGVCYLIVRTGKDKPEAKFELLPNKQWFKFFKNGEEITQSAILSKLFTDAYASQIESTFNSLNTYYSVLNFAEEVKQKEEKSFNKKDDVFEEELF